MPYPNQKVEKKLYRTGFKYIAGVDEAGRGAWAGPIVAAAVILDPKIKIKGIKDSKLLRKPERQRLDQLIKTQAVAWAVGSISQGTIDELGITKANILAMQAALKQLNRQPDYLLIDALPLDYAKMPYQNIIDGDYKVISIAAASIIAKVYRDELMDRLDEEFPAYGFKQHKGYGTAHHFQMINQYGICQLHRRSFKPIKDFIN
ncbi:MAG: ribonuclease HII [Patescibacteria group bacterium]|jgi:ribonuclease HII|nr:ribonuclease HII [Patescibacteria group bacterium]